MPEPLPPMIERNLAAQALLPSQRPVVEFFTRSLTSFQDSGSRFQVICTLPPPSWNRQSDISRFINRVSNLPSPLPPTTRPRALVVLDSSFNPPSIAHLRMAVSAIRDLRKTTGTGDKDQVGSSALRLLLLLAINNADKAPKPAPFEQRLAMMWAFAKDIQHTLTDKEERQSSQTSETPEDGIPIDVALSTQPYFTDKSAAIAEADFYLPQGTANTETPDQVILVGYDTLIRILNPKYYGTADGGPQTPMQRALNPFFARVHLRVTMRTDDEWGGKDDQLAYVESLVSGDRLESIGGAKAWASRIELVEGRFEGEDIVSSTLAREAGTLKDWDKLSKYVTPGVKKWIEVADPYEGEAQ